MNRISADRLQRRRRRRHRHRRLLHRPRRLGRRARRPRHQQGEEEQFLNSFLNVFYFHFKINLSDNIFEMEIDQTNTVQIWYRYVKKVKG